MTEDPKQNNLGYWCHRPVRDTPDRICIVDLCGDGEREITYGALDAGMNRAASALAASGLKPGDRVALGVGNRYEFVEIMFGAMRAGIVPVPLNVKLGAHAMKYIMQDAGCVGAIIEPSCGDALVQAMGQLDLTTRVTLGAGLRGWMPYARFVQGHSSGFEAPALPDGHPAFQPYTSGSTGKPKGVVLSHAGQLWWIRVAQRYWPSQPDDRALTAVPLYHKNAMAGAIKPMLHAGGSVVLLPDFEPVRFLETLSAYRCTHAGAVPAVFTRLLQQRDVIQRMDLSALSGLSIGSAPVPPELMIAVREAFGVPVRESYGLTEGGPVMIGPPLDGQEVPLGSCGVPWPEGEVKLMAPDGAEDKQFGELWVRNPGVTSGFHNLPDVNAARIRDGWLATGDLFSVDDEGFFYFRGRTDDMFDCGGENVYPKEVENLLLAHPHVNDAAVVPLAHPVKGHVPVAMVVALIGSPVTVEDIKRFCLDNGPGYAHPRRVLLVDALPLSGVGKPDRLRVAEVLRERFGSELAGGSGAVGW